MKYLLRAALLGLPLLVTPAEAFGWGTGSYAWRADFGNKCVIGFGGAPQAGPWYLYWPYDAHFNVAAPPFGTGCAPCGMSWAWYGGNYGAGGMGWDASGAGGYGGYGGSCANGACAPGVNYGQQPGAQMVPQTPVMARPNMPMAPQAHPAGFQPAGYYNQVPSYWYGR
jgi:hypothetical protein